MDWVPLWNKTLYSRKVQSLPGETYKAWANCLLVANQLNAGGLLLPIDDLSMALHLNVEDAKKMIGDLIFAGLLELRGEELHVHDWDQWQVKQDNSTERVRKFREKEKGRKEKYSGNGGNRGNVSRVSCNGDAFHETRETHETEETDETPKRKEKKIREEDPPTPLKRDETHETHETFHPVSSLPEMPSPDREWDRVANLAAEIGGDISWALWAINRFKMGDEPKIIEAALSEAVNAGKINQKYVASIAQRFAKEGIPKATASRMSYGKNPPEPLPPYYTASKDVDELYKREKGRKT